MDFFQNLRDAHRRAVEGALVVAIREVGDVGLFVREDVHINVIVDLRVVVTKDRLRFILDLHEARFSFFERYLAI
jgi:hypothetical protein